MPRFAASEEFCYLNSSSVKKCITIMFMTSSRCKFTLLQKNSATDVCVGFRPPCWSSSGWAPAWVKHLLGYLVYQLFLRPKSWRGSLYIYLLSFPRFWALFVEWFWFLFWSILDGVTLKTSSWTSMLWTINCCQEGYPLTSVTWLHRGLRFTTHGSDVIF